MALLQPIKLGKNLLLKEEESVLQVFGKLFLISFLSSNWENENKTEHPLVVLFLQTDN
jgi:hypothetical protein